MSKKVDDSKKENNLPSSASDSNNVREPEKKKRHIYRRSYEAFSLEYNVSVWGSLGDGARRVMPGGRKY